MNTVTTVEQAYYDLIYDRENVKVQEKAVELATQLVVENKKRVEVGALAPLDEQQAEAQAASSQAALIAARSALAVQENTVKQLITDDYAAMGQRSSLQPTATLTAPVSSSTSRISWSKGLTQRPDLLQAKLDVEARASPSNTTTTSFSRNWTWWAVMATTPAARASANSARRLDQMAEGSRPDLFLRRRN